MWRYAERSGEMLKEDVKLRAKAIVGFPVRVVPSEHKKRLEDQRMKEHYKIYRITPEVISRIINRIKDL